VAVTAANIVDREVIDELLGQSGTGAAAGATQPATGEPAVTIGADSGSGSAGSAEPKGFEVYGDSAYADGATLDEQAARSHDADTAAMGAAAAEQATPKPKAQRNFTNPDSKIILTGDGTFHQCYNAQAVVDADHQVIVATNLGANAADVGNFIVMTAQATANTGATPRQMFADAGYCSMANLAEWVYR
jgi:hypothetical protein